MLWWSQLAGWSTSYLVNWPTGLLVTNLVVKIVVEKEMGGPTTYRQTRRLNYTYFMVGMH